MGRKEQDFLSRKDRCRKLEGEAAQGVFQDWIRVRGPPGPSRCHLSVGLL